MACCVLLTLAGRASTADDGDDGVAGTAGGTTGGSGAVTTQGVEESDTGSSTAQAEETIGEADTTVGDTTAGDTTGASGGPCHCFEADPKRSDFEVTCYLPQSCGNSEHQITGPTSPMARRSTMRVCWR